MSGSDTQGGVEQGEPRLILASASARRRALLRSAGVRFDLHVSEVEETLGDGETPVGFAARLAREKAEAVARVRREEGDARAVLGADTIVVIGEEILGKPTDRTDARRMIQTLSGRTHEVVTALCLCPRLGSVDAVAATVITAVTTAVTFKELTTGEIETYLDRAEWADKAGAYAIQDEAAFMVRSIAGSYTNVVGLPLCETLELLEEAGVIER